MLAAIKSDLNLQSKAAKNNYLSGNKELQHQ
jgi:hypothetical protein